MPPATAINPEQVSTLTIAKEIEIAAPIATAWEAVLDQMGPKSQMPDGKPFPFVLEAWPGGRLWLESELTGLVVRYGPRDRGRAMAMNRRRRRLLLLALGLTAAVSLAAWPIIAYLGVSLRWQAAPRGFLFEPYLQLGDAPGRSHVLPVSINVPVPPE